MPFLSLILVTHNSGRWLGKFIDSWEAALRNAPPLAAAGVEILIADSGSSDDTTVLVERLAPDAHPLVCGNVGFGTAANAAARAAQSPWLLVCNPDLVFSPTFAQVLLEPLIAGAAVPWREAGCVAPRLVNADGSEQPSVGRFPTVGALLCDQFRPRVRRKYHFPQPSVLGEIDWASGACLLLRRDAFLAVGGFDEKYFLYVEEVDLQRRLKDAGHQTWFVPEAVVTHLNPNAARDPRPEAQRYAARGMLRYFAKFGGASLWAYRLGALITGRLSLREALASRAAILERSTGDFAAASGQARIKG